MDFSLNDEQKMVQDAVARFVERGYPFETYLETSQTDTQLNPNVWKQFAEMGWLGQPLPESVGGYGQSTAGQAVDTMLFAEGLGAGLVTEPFIANVILAGNLLAATKQTELAEAMIAGEQQLATACNERAGRFNLNHCETTTNQDGSKTTLNGQKYAVLNGANAQTFIVSARTSGNAKDAQGIELFLVDAQAEGLTIQAYKLLGGGTAAELRLNNVAATPIGGSLDDLERAFDLATAAVCAQALGGMKALVQRTQEYLKVRKQFNVPIGSFQVLQHRLVDMFIELEQSQSMVYYATGMVSSDDRDTRRQAVSSAKAYINKASKFVAQQAVQLHGGIGMTEELDVGHYFRQLTALSTLFGDRDYHLDQLVALRQSKAA